MKLTQEELRGMEPDVIILNGVRYVKEEEMTARLETRSFITECVEGRAEQAEQERDMLRRQRVTGRHKTTCRICGAPTNNDDGVCGPCSSPWYGL